MRLIDPADEPHFSAVATAKQHTLTKPVPHHVYPQTAWRSLMHHGETGVVMNTQQAKRVMQ